MRIYNSLTRQIEEFKPITAGKVGIYTCGPTIYDYATIGNFRTYTTADLLVRTLKFLNYDVHYVMNLTDVGHLSGDNEGDADTGVDRMEKGSKREGKTAWEIADFYGRAFLVDFEKMNFAKPQEFPKATDHIAEQIEIVRKLETHGFTYKTKDGIYFDTEKYEITTGSHYGDLSDLDQIKEGARVAKNPEKKNPRDFALWKFSESPGERHMEWESPWGIGFPGWHIECSAMSMKYLGETFDIHVGGEDLKQTHHPNEIAQSEGATGKKFVNYWVHSKFLLVNSGRMGKSLGNAYTINDIEEKGFSPIALRYFYLTAHYRDKLNFTWEALESAQNALNNLGNIVAELRNKLASATKRTSLSEGKMQKVDGFRERFSAAISDDLKMPSALAVTWEVAKSNIPEGDKLDLLLLFDEVLGLKLNEAQIKKVEITPEIQALIDRREQLRRDGNFKEADKIRDELVKIGVEIQDTAHRETN